MPEQRPEFASKIVNAVRLRLGHSGVEPTSRTGGRAHCEGLREGATGKPESEITIKFSEPNCRKG